MFPRELLPGWYEKSNPNGKYRFHLNTRTAKLIDDHGGNLVMFSKLPRECQLAMAHYMAIDGEAWEAPEAVYEAYRKANKCTFGGTARRKHTATAFQMFIDSLPLIVQRYGSVPFGYIAALPLKVLIESVMKDADLKQDYGADWSEYHKWYMAGGLKHKATSDLWPVILDSFKDDTLQDGWNRFHNYAERRLETCPALFYPRERKRKVLAA